MTKNTVAEDIAEFVVNLKYKDIPNRIIKKAKDQILGVIAAIYAGSLTDEGKIIINTVKQFGDKEESSLIPSGFKTSVRSSVLCNSSVGVALDYVDYLLSGHTGVSAVPVSLAVGESLNSTGKEVITAQIIANEIEGRLGTSVFLGPQNGQLWSYIHLIGGAVAASRLLGLNEDQVANAIGIALAQSTYTIFRGYFAMAKLFVSGLPAQIGVQAAYFAKNGLRGAHDIIEHPLGFCNLMADIPLKFITNSALGKAWVTDTLCYKIYPGCAYVDAIADCILDLHKEFDINYKEIKRVEVFSSILTTAMDDFAAPFTTIDSLKKEQTHVALNFTVPYTVAATLIDKELTPRQFKKERYLNPEIHNLANKVKIIPDSKISSEILGTLPAIKIPSLKEIISGKYSLADINLDDVTVAFAGAVKIIMNNGKKYYKKQNIPYGAPGNPYDLKKKFTQEAINILPSEKIDPAIRAINNIEAIENIGDLIQKICSQI
ncbi:MAG: MmgE/PrpD family protein [Candidatus Helarchaeota archaeon]